MFCCLLPLATFCVSSLSGMGLELGWGFRIRTDTVAGRIWVDSEQPRRGILLRYFTVCMGILTRQKWIPNSDGSGRGSRFSVDSGGFLDPGSGIRQPRIGGGLYTQPPRVFSPCRGGLFTSPHETASGTALVVFEPTHSTARIARNLGSGALCSRLLTFSVWPTFTSLPLYVCLFYVGDDGVAVGAGHSATVVFHTAAVLSHTASPPH